MAFHNRVRLPLTIDKPQFGGTKQLYTKANGDTVLLSSTLKKTYQGSTDWMPEKWLEALFIGLNHSHVAIEGEKYMGGVALDGDTYQIDWDEIFHTPAAGVKFQVLVTPYDESNPNCLTCSEAGQLQAVDDTMPDPLEENTTYEIDVVANDNICCYPVSFSILSFNSDYLDSVTIDASGTATLHLKTGLTIVNNLKLFTYRVTCGDGDVFDDADVFGNVNGSVSACLAPTGLIISDVTDTTFHAAWTAPSPAPGHYLWQILSSPGGVVLQSGDTPDTFFDGSGLIVNTPYSFQVAGECADTDGDDESNFIRQDFSTTPADPLHCGSFRLFPSAGASTGTITYLGCDGLYHTIAATILTPVTICALQSAPGVYADISSTFTTLTITYLDFCGGRPKAILSFRFVHDSGGSFLQFTESLTVPIDANIIINRVFADGFPTMPCGVSSTSAQKNSSQTIVAGDSGAGAPPESFSASWAGIAGYRIYNVLINGSAYLDGAVIPMGSYDVTLDIPSCI